MHTPPMAAITGLALSSIMLIRFSRFGGVPAFGVPNSRMSAPPEKPLPEPINTTASIAGSALARSTAAAIDWRNSRPRLLTGGLANVTTAIPFLISKPALLVLIILFHSAELDSVLGA